jgi:single-stranded-DNA-specific exonuclease
MSESPPRLTTRTVAHYVERLGLPKGAPLAQYLDPRLSDLTPPEQMADRKVTAERLASAIRKQERVVVFGDYDCDGMTAAAILSDVIEELGGIAIPHLASRFHGGYGLSKEALERILKSEPALVVTCDCGSSDHASLRKLKERGIDALVIDHHLVPDEPLPALAFLNPHRPECGFPEKGLASCGLVLSIAAALRAELGAKLDVRKWLDLVAIGSVADVAPLTGDNRALVRAGLGTLRRAERPGVRCLMDLAGVDRSHPLTAADIAFRIAPRLNAPGRLQAPDLAFRLLREKDPEKARALADEVEHLCQVRRSDQAKIEQEAREEIARLGLQQAPAIVVGREGWNHGIVGIVAGRVAEEFDKPTVVIGFEKGVGRGSLRGPAGFRLFDALSECARHLVRFGGHQAAAGMEIRIDALEAFRAAYEAACQKRADFERPPKAEPLPVDPRDDLYQVLQDLYLLEPCGEKNPAPLLALSCEIRASREVKGGHLKLDLEMSGGRRVGGFGPGLGGASDRYRGPATVIGKLRPDTYRGGEAVELLVERVIC